MSGKGFYYQDRLTAQLKAAIVSLHHGSAHNDAASSSSRSLLTTFDISKEEAEQLASATTYGLQRYHDLVPLHATP